MPEDKPQRRSRPAYALVYAAMIPIIQEIGRDLGYAVAVHGSMATDLDLLACPWTEEATDPETLIKAISERFHCIYQESHQTNPAIKPHGRLAWAIMFDPSDDYAIGGPYLDISVMPRNEGCRGGDGA
ncbi:MAG TPA: hypothetical protein VKU00_03865 [Chthonomonadaceae bacterium]|nr:hypothetical protein [Chthonomonadaceae bacterium]